MFPEEYEEQHTDESKCNSTLQSRAIEKHQQNLPSNFPQQNKENQKTLTRAFKKQVQFFSKKKQKHIYP